MQVDWFLQIKLKREDQSPETGSLQTSQQSVEWAIIQRKPLKTNTGTRLLQELEFISTDLMPLATSTESERFEPMNVGTGNEQPPVLSPVNRTETELESSLPKYLETKQSPIQKLSLSQL
jgi:hypothetical protein